MKRLGKNLNGYAGERIDIAAVVSDCAAAARTHGWAVEEIHPAPKQILAFTRMASRGGSPLRVYLSTGIHGDEPAGPLAARQLLRANHWPPGLEICLCPCLNPTGFQLNRRENADGIDLNRDYLGPTASEAAAHVAWLNQQPKFDLCLCLHEDWESHGFYVYELNPEHQPSLGRPAQNGIIRPNLDPRSRPQWPEAFFLITHKTRLSYTLEAPSDFPLSTRVAALVAGASTALEALAGQAGVANR